MKKYILILISALGLISCEQVIPFEITSAESQLVVDAWITDELKEQKVKLSFSQAYFDSNAVKPVLGATVYLVKQDSSIILLKDNKNNGVYSFTPKTKDYIKEGEQVGLYIKYNTEEFYALSKLNRVPKIDSLDYEASSTPNGPPDPKLPKEGFIAQFYAKDLEGEGDTYLIRKTINDTLKNKPSQYQLAYDAGFSPGSKSDGLLFILPIRQSITNGFFNDKDKVKIDLFSLPIEAYYFFLQIRQESQNGGIFATPLSNIPTNIINRNKGSKTKALGAFIVSKVSSFETIIDKNKAKPKKIN
jgi:Domain of unknown function (DUF4249)